MAGKASVVKLENDWLNWCRLCAKDDVRGNVKVLGTGAWDNVILMAIKKYFEVHMRLEDELSSMLCTECYTLISELIDFAEHVTKVQAIFEVLRRTDSAKLDVPTLRQQYGLRETDWTHIIKPPDCDAENSDLKPTDLDREFVDLGKTPESIEKEPEVPSTNNFPLEQFEVVGCHEKAESAPKPIKRPRGRPKGTKAIETASDPPRKAVKHAAGAASENDKLDIPNSSELKGYQEPLLLASSPAIFDLKPKPVDVTDSDGSNIEISGSNAVINLKPDCMKCNVCGKSYVNGASYLKHLERGCNVVKKREPHRPKKDKNTTCEICNKTLSSQASLKMHKEGMHGNSKPFICDCCGKALKTITALNEHKLVHTDDRPFVCPVCKAGFKNKARLKIHHQIHEEPSFVCNICGKKLQTRRTWNMHKLVHTEERKLKCDVCGAGFKRSKTLKTHLLSHTGLRPYVCNYCKRSFACNANCRAHKLKHHSKEMEQEDDEGRISRLSVPTLEELRVMTQKIANVPDET